MQIHRITIFILFAVLLCPGIAFTADVSRLALVIGNADYDHAVFPALSNPVHDARDVARVLEELCFEVMLEQNADRERMFAAIEEFGRRLAQTGGLGLFYYSGHGLQDGQRHYLIPLRSGVYEEKELAMKAVDADTIAQQMKLAGNASNVLIFDTCRERLNLEHFGRSIKDLIAMEGPVNSVLVYSTSLGQSAFGDSAARNSLYTRHLVQALQESSDRDLLEILRTVNRRVTDEAVFYQLNASSWKFLQKKGLPEELLQTLRHPELYQQDFTQQQFEQLLQELFPPAQYKQYYPLIQSAAEQRQAPWLYTNITEEMVLSESCPSAFGNRPPLSVNMLIFPETHEIVLSPEPTAIEFMALLNRAVEDVRYAWSLNSDFGRLEGDPASSRVRYIPPEQIEADMTAVNITLIVQQAGEEIRQEKTLILLAGKPPETLSLPKDSVKPTSSPSTWKWLALAGGGTLGGAATVIAVNGIGISSNSGSDAEEFPFRGQFISNIIPDSSGTITFNSQIEFQLEQQDTQITGHRERVIFIQGCSASARASTPVYGNFIEADTIQLAWKPITLTFSCHDQNYTLTEPEAGEGLYRLINDNRTLLSEGGADREIPFQRTD